MSETRDGAKFRILLAGQFDRIEIMRWFNFAILAFVTLVAQSGVSGMCWLLGSWHVVPDLLLMLAVVIAFRGPAEHVPIAGWVLGLAKDLSCDSALGSYALAFGVATLVIAQLRELFYGERAITLIIITLAASLFVEHFVVLIGLIRGDIGVSYYRSVGIAVVVSSMVTAALSPYEQWLIMKLHRQIGVPRFRGYGR